MSAPRDDQRVGDSTYPAEFAASTQTMVIQITCAHTTQLAPSTTASELEDSRQLMQGHVKVIRTGVAY
jgi:hypothetical protein